MSDLHDEYGQSFFDFGIEFLSARPYTAPAGSASGQTSSRSEDWYTHKEIVDLVHELYGGPPDLDPMSCAEANLTVKALEFYSAEDDGLNHRWYGKMLWNPPWGGADASAAKKRGLVKLLQAYESSVVTECVCVLNANATTTAWFAPLLSFPVCFPPRRIAHYGPDGKGGSPNSGTVIIYVGRQVDRFAEVFSGLGAIMVPYSSGVLFPRSSHRLPSEKINSSGLRASSKE
jgi:hypothetical protein